MKPENISEMKTKRQIAYKIPIVLLQQGNYIIQQEQEPNYLEIENGFKIYRVNIIAVIIGKEKVGMITNIYIDDGTGTITARLFEESKSLRLGEVGDVIQLIGRIRVYNEERYLSPEILTKIEATWLKVRSKEIKNCLQEITKIGVSKKRDEEASLEKKENKKTEDKESELMIQTNLKLPKKRNDKKELILPTESNNFNIDIPHEKILKIIKELDKGLGVFMEEIIKASPLTNTEAMIHQLLERGDIFQNQPGRVKVL